METTDPTPEQTSAIAQAALQEAQGTLHTLQAARGALVRAYHTAIEEATADRMVELDQQLRALDLRLREANVRLDAARVGAERAAVQVAEDQCRAISVRLDAAKEERRAARARLQAAGGDIRREREGLAAELAADQRVRALIDEERDAIARLSRAKLRVNEAIAAARRRID
jgi:hypothetical protein